MCQRLKQTQRKWRVIPNLCSILGATAVTGSFPNGWSRLPEQLARRSSTRLIPGRFGWMCITPDPSVDNGTGQIHNSGCFRKKDVSSAGTKMASIAISIKGQCGQLWKGGNSCYDNLSAFSLGSKDRHNQISLAKVNDGTRGSRPLLLYSAVDLIRDREVLRFYTFLYISVKMYIQMCSLLVGWKMCIFFLKKVYKYIIFQ